jgi:hypothetical protein
MKNEIASHAWLSDARPAAGRCATHRGRTQVLRLPEHAAYLAIEAARAARKWPVLLELLADYALHLTAVGLLAPHLTADTHQRVRYRPVTPAGLTGFNPVNGRRARELGVAHDHNRDHQTRAPLRLDLQISLAVRVFRRHGERWE